MGTLTPHIDAYLTERRATGTYTNTSIASVGSRLTSLDGHHGTRPLTALDEPTIVAWLGLHQHLTVNTRSSYLASARQFTAWATRRGILEHDPCLHVRAGTRTRPTPRALTTRQVAAIIRACRTERDRLIVWLMVGLGLRRAEVAGLDWEDYDDRDELLVIRHAKGGDERVLPVPSVVAEVLAESRGARFGPVVAARQSGRRLSPHSVGLLVSEVMRRAGVKRAAFDGVSAHALRHTFASDVLDRTGDLRDVQQLLGHASLRSTQIYLRRRSATQLRAAVEGRDYGGMAEAA